MELMLAMSLLAGLLTFTFLIFRMGSNSWKSVEAKAKLQSEMQVATARLTREVERSTYASASLDPPGVGSACSFACPLDNQAQVSLNSGSGRPDWHQYLVFYHNATTRELWFRSLPIGAGDPERTSAEPIELFDAAGPQPLAFFRTQGKPLARWVAGCRFTMSAGLLQGELAGEHPRSWSATPERFSLRVVSLFRN